MDDLKKINLINTLNIINIYIYKIYHTYIYYTCIYPYIEKCCVFVFFHVFKRRKMQKLEILDQINQNITNVPLRNRRRFELETKSFVDEIKKANYSRANDLFRIWQLMTVEWSMRLQILQQLKPAKNSPLMLARKENEDINDYRDKTINAMEDL